MARLDVHALRGSRGAGYVVDVQAELLSYLTTRIVVPLLPEADSPPRMGELNPVFEIDGRPHVLMTQALAAIPRRELTAAIASLSVRQDQVTRALDTLLIGF